MNPYDELLSNVDERLKNTGSERDQIAEAIMVCRVEAKDLDGKSLGGGERIPVEIMKARAVVDMLPLMGWKIVKCEPTVLEVRILGGVPP